MNFGTYLASRLNQVKREDEVHPHFILERAEQFHAIDGGSSELEVLTFVNALVHLFKPTLCLELDDAARLTGRSFSGMADQTWTHDEAGQVTAIRHFTQAQGEVEAMTFTYDEVGNRKAIRDMAGNQTTYLYDAKDRLVGDITRGHLAHRYTYAYDANDNRVLSTETGSLVTSSFDAANRLVTSLEGTDLTTFSFDPNGNMTGSATGSDLVTMSYDKENRLRIHEQTASIATFSYDGDGLKIIEEVDGVMSTVIWDGLDRIGEVT